MPREDDNWRIGAALSGDPRGLDEFLLFLRAFLQTLVDKDKESLQ
jgi:hypothetical protein